MKREIKEIKYKIDIVAKRMSKEFGSEVLTDDLNELGCEENEFLQRKSEISSKKASYILSDIFASTGVFETIKGGNRYCAYLDFATVKDLMTTISQLQGNRDSRLHTVDLLREVGMRFAELAYHLNQGILAHREALRVLKVSVMLYDICQRMMPDVFPDIDFEVAEDDFTFIDLSEQPT